ncbi:hypothetical protein JIG36_50820 [Actinoplanes sp. LDG1-06]|uniref:ABC transporter permease n=1 Tax=Paractinoplanes ovalisporus TaxID=2810368 RepID=A0ABS2AV99_9ACTN|nr:hypothetical protein [Actinoplanes ovalisporus]MBM2623812.1 hypothetical protein [Actinoplanes ovalisporus]
MTGPLLIELKRSNARILGLVVGAVGAISLASIFEGSRQWNMFAYADAAIMCVLAPLALAGGAMLGRREQSTRAAELMHSTGRPSWQRITPAAAALAAAVTGAHLLLAAVGIVLMLLYSSYIGARGLMSILVDVPLLIGAALLGIAAGRVWPSRLLPPLLASAAFAIQMAADSIPAIQGLSLIGPQPEADWESVTDPVLLGRLGFAFGLVLGGYLLSAGTSWIFRAGGSAAVAGGAAVMLAVSPTGSAERYLVDADAQRLVCADGVPQVCVTAVHAYLLPSVVPQARAALAKLAKLPYAPTRAVEWRPDSIFTGDEADYLGNQPKTVQGTVSFRLDLDEESEDTDVEASILNGAGTTANGCTLDDTAALWAAGAWLTGGDTLDITDRVFGWQLAQSDYQPVLVKLRQAPEAEQVRRVTALRDAANVCQTKDLTAILTGRRDS